MRAMSSAPAPLANGTSSAAEVPARATAMSFGGGCPFADAKPLGTKAPRAPARPTPQPPPPPPPPRAPSPDPDARPHDARASAFQPSKRGQKPPPKERVATRPPLPSAPRSRSRRLAPPIHHTVPSVASARAARNSPAPILSFNDPRSFPQRLLNPPVIYLGHHPPSPTSDPSHQTSIPRHPPHRQLPPKSPTPNIRPALRSQPLPRPPKPPPDPDTVIPVEQPNTHAHRRAQSAPPLHSTSRSPSPRPPHPTPQMPPTPSPRETAPPVTKRRRTTSSVPRNQPSYATNSCGRLRERISPSEPTQVQFVRASSPPVSTSRSAPPQHRSLPTSRATRAPRPVPHPAPDDVVTLVPNTTNVDQPQIIRLFNWQAASYDKHNAILVLETMMREQPRYIDLSFLGLADSDFRDLLEQPIPSAAKAPCDIQRHIQLNNNRLQRMTEYIFDTFCSLNVVSLTLSCNRLRQIHPSISLCSQLRILELSRNELKAIPEEIVALKEIQCLNLSYNRITKLPPSFKQLRQLKILNVSHNNLECLPDDVAQPRSVLTALDVSHNPSFNFLPKSCENWTHLEDLMLQGTQLHAHLTRKELGLSATRLVEEIAGRAFSSSRPRYRRKRPVRVKNTHEVSVEAVDDDKVVKL